jgi:hypothetical protein
MAPLRMGRQIYMKRIEDVTQNKFQNIVFEKPYYYRVIVKTKQNKSGVPNLVFGLWGSYIEAYIYCGEERGSRKWTGRFRMSNDELELIWC